MRTLTKQDMLDLLVGAGILGCGGGGSAELGRQLIDAIFDSGKQFTLIDPKDVPDSEYLCTVSGVGGGIGKEIKDKLQSYLSAVEKQNPVEVLTSTAQKAVRELESLTGVRFFSYLPSEIGPRNTVLPMYLAALEDKPAVDADGCGRAKPEMSLSTSHLAGIPVAPMTIVNSIGDVMVVKKAADDYRGEDIARYMAVISGGNAIVCRAPNTAGKYKAAIVPNSISRSMMLGALVRENKAKKANVVQSILKSEPGWVRLFQGKIKAWKRKDEAGFRWGEVKIDGVADFHRRRLKIWYKNEYLITWMNDKPYATCPDSICIVDASSGEGLSCAIPNVKKHIGKEVAVLGFKAHDLWRTDQGVALFGPKHFGYDIKYVPVEKAAADLIPQRR